MAGPVMRVFQTTTHAFNTYHIILTEPKAGRKAQSRACRKGETRVYTMLKASHSRALGHIQLDRYTREQVSRLAASTLSRSLSTGSEIDGPRPKGSETTRIRECMPPLCLCERLPRTPFRGLWVCVWPRGP
jgi:hypothetical protein